MTGKLEYKGEWFLPSDKSKRLNGILIYDADEGSTLELYGSFDDTPIMPLLKNEDIIQGITTNSTQVTLYNCFILKTGGLRLVLGEESGTPTTIYRVNFVLEGIHIDALEDVKFQKIVSEIHNLDEWVGVSGFTPDNVTAETLKNFEVNVHYKLPEPIKFSINDRVEGQFNFVVNQPGWSRYIKNVSLNQRVEVIFTSQSDYTIEELLKYLFSFQNFLILALYNRTYPTSISLYSDKLVKDYCDGKPVRKKVKLYFPISNSSKLDEPKIDLEMLFGYGHIKDEFPEIIKNWFAKNELLEPAFNLLFEHFYNNERFTENTFLNLAQAAETFHARIHNHTKMPKSDYDKMKEEICSIAPAKYLDWLKEQFNFGNQLNLQTRLTEIVTKYSNEVLDKILGDKELFVKQVKWSRNYYTHYSESGKKQAIRGAQLFYLTEKLKIVLVCAFLIEVGFDREKLKKCLEFNKHRFFNYLVKW